MERDAASRRGSAAHDELTLWIEAKTARRSPRTLTHLFAAAARLVWSASPRGVVEAATLQLVTAVCAGLTVLLGKRVLEDILAVADGGDLVARAAIDVVLFAFVSSLAASTPAFQVQQQRELGEHVGRRVWDDLLDVTSSVDLESYESPEFFTGLQRVQSNALLRPMTTTTALLSLLGGAAGTVSVALAVLLVAPVLLPIMLALGVPALLLSRRASHTEFAFAVAQTDNVRRRTYLRHLLTARVAAAEVRANGSARFFRHRHGHISRDYLRGMRRQIRIRQRYALIGVATSAVALGLTLLILVLLLDRGSVDVAAAGAALVGVRMLGSRLDQLVSSSASLFESGPFLRDLHEFLALAPTREVNRHEQVKVGPLERIRAESVSFRYPGSDRLVLQDVDLDIHRGEVVALVGENGSGKSTLAKLVAGLYRPTSGAVTYDGTDLTEVPREDVMRSVAVVFQDFLRYQLTAGENVGIGDERRIDDQAGIRLASANAGAHGFLSALPDGYRTMLSKEYDAGQDLSGGQWQRVALARALFRDSSLVVLDEPSASLDARSESELFNDMRRLLDGRAALLISHRFSSVRLADRIYVLHDGRIVDSGTHDELLARGGLYAELFALQARSYF